MLHGPSWVQFTTRVSTSQGLGIKVLQDILQQFYLQVKERGAAGSEVVATSAGCLPGSLFLSLTLNT